MLNISPRSIGAKRDLGISFGGFLVSPPLVELLVSGKLSNEIE